MIELQIAGQMYQIERMTNTPTVYRVRRVSDSSTKYITFYSKFPHSTEVLEAAVQSAYEVS